MIACSVHQGAGRVHPRWRQVVQAASEAVGLTCPRTILPNAGVLCSTTLTICIVRTEFKPSGQRRATPRGADTDVGEEVPVPPANSWPPGSGKPGPTS